MSTEPEELNKLGKSDQFHFSCEKKLNCFNECCADVNIFLTPYDVIRMKNRLGLTSSEFLDKYTICPFTKEQKLPVLILKLKDDEKKKCPFISKDGCTIYEDRPWSCRMYPVGLASQKIREKDDDKDEYYFVQEDKKCMGLGSKKRWSIQDWIDDQGASSYSQFSSLYREIILHPYFKKGTELTPHKMDMFHMVFYNLDKFRTFIFDSTFAERFEISDETLEGIKKDDTKLLNFGVRWLKFSLFGEPTFRIKGELTETDEE